MNLPSLKEEKALFKKELRLIAGIDEAGRGPLAGPVVAAIVVFNNKSLERWLNFGIKDSKFLSEKKRKELFYVIKKEAVEVKTASVSEKVIDKINIRQATLLAMRRAFLGLKSNPEFVLIDGRDTIRNLTVNQKAIINGDESSVVIAAASIIAKETRDNVMRRFAKKYPVYGFEKHKGYGTKFHREMIRRNGSCSIHRQSFKLL